MRKLRAEEHVLSLVVDGNVEGIAQRGQALGAISIDVQPIGLREVFLDSLAEDRL